MTLGILSASCSCEFDASDRCICTVSGQAQVPYAGKYKVHRCWWQGDSLLIEPLFAKTVEVGDSARFEYSGHFDNTDPAASYYIITLFGPLFGQDPAENIGDQAVITPEECEEDCPDPQCDFEVI